MSRSGSDPQLTVAASFSLVEGVNHLSGHIIVRLAVDKEDGQLRSRHLRQRRGLQEVPPITRAAKHAGGVKHRHLGQAELGAQLLAKLIPDAGIAAVFHKAAHVSLLLFAGHHHHRGGAHRHAVQSDRGSGAKKLISDARPADHIEAVEPTHADIIAAAQASAVEVGQEDVEAQIMVIEIANHKHAHGAIGVAVNDDGRAARGPRSTRVERM